MSIVEIRPANFLELPNSSEGIEFQTATLDRTKEDGT